jgi:hypothetical protein
MSTFVWSPAWHHHGESFWSIACKIAYANNTPISSVVELLAKVTGSRARSIFITCAITGALNICKALNISTEVAGRLFNSFEPLPRQEREYLSLGLRWCPQCLQIGFHSILFQDWRVLSCPWHGCRLLDSCLRCDRAVDPLMQSAWHCNCCNAPIFSPPKNWITLFRLPFENTGVERKTQDVFAIECVESGSGVQDFYWVNPVADTSLERRARLPIQISEWVREEVAVLVDSLLLDHQDCISSELEASLVQYGKVSFTCPVAGAIACVASWFDVSLVDDCWLTASRPNYRSASGWFDFELQAMPLWSRRLLVRETFRAWLMDAVAKFTGAADLGLNFVAWAPNRSLDATWCACSSKVTLKSHCNWHEFRTLVGTHGHGQLRVATSAFSRPQL